MIDNLCNSWSFIRIMAALLMGMVSLQAQDQAIGAFAAFHRPPGASQAAVGHGILSVGSATVIFSNPAGMHYLKNSQLSFNYLAIQPDLNQQYLNIAFTQHLGRKWSIGVGTISYSVSDIIGYSDQADFTGVYGLDEWLAVFALSTEVLKPLSIGIALQAANQVISGPDKMDSPKLAYGLNYGLVYHQYDSFILSVSSDLPLHLSEDETSLPRLRSSLEIALPFFKRSTGGDFLMVATNQTEMGHWSTGFLGIHIKYPLGNNLAFHLNGRTPGFVLQSEQPDFQTMEKWGMGGGLEIRIAGNLRATLDMAYLNERYFDQLYTSIEIKY